MSFNEWETLSFPHFFGEFNASEEDSEELAKYKDLLNKEYAFCVKIVDDILAKASKIYDKQIYTGKVQMFACDFAKLEGALADWNELKS
ncbi:Toxin ToxN, type III toxin-antitoxin system [Butyrivibrio fibrisolvens]|uniref:Toxin ToxN, type III toxin-antitoxin system n=1 Tax=Butyrivibrio fibrisolvens TaxID=831 RepID=A0A1H9LSG3_BUTFI|nr:type III toxin-antitoxin system ToxN/AbiQ family toxin [Butyrivibrio fibrisolvens]SER14374.1 Toxin ToxN, type III toxin-antitoxin system [Butyrivibrio fibrisolvens]